MAIKTEKELSEPQRAHWLKAVAAIELRNFGYAISLLQGILRQEPEFLTGRQLLRRAGSKPEYLRWKRSSRKIRATPNSCTKPAGCIINWATTNARSKFTIALTRLIPAMRWQRG